MSLWYESLSLCLYDCAEDIEQRAKCILAYLSMVVPRSWWEHALETGTIPESYVNVLHDLHKELQKVPELAERLEFGLLVALAFADNPGKSGPKFGSLDAQHSIGEYLTKAADILIDHPELDQLGEAIKNRSLRLAL